jgi:hypothetical protein
VHVCNPCQGFFANLKYPCQGFCTLVAIHDAKVIQGGVMYLVAPLEEPSPMALSGEQGDLVNTGGHGVKVVQVSSGHVVAWHVVWLQDLDMLCVWWTCGWSGW